MVIPVPGNDDDGRKAGGGGGGGASGDMRAGPLL